MPSSLYTDKAGLAKEGGDMDETREDEIGSDTDSGEGCVLGSEEDPEQEGEEEEAERKGIQEEMKEMAKCLRDLASVIDYNTEYTDPRAGNAHPKDQALNRSHQKNQKEGKTRSITYIPTPPCL